MMVLKEKTMSGHLLGLIRKAATSLLNLRLLWMEIKQVGEKEGFSEKELEQRTRKELWQLPDMTRGKMYYFFHREQRNEEAKSYQRKVSKRRQLATSDTKNDNANANHAGDNEYRQHDEESITETKIKFDPKHFNKNNIHYYDIEYLRKAVLYYYEENQRLNNNK